MTLFLTLPNGPDLATIGLKIVGNMKLLKIHSEFFLLPPKGAPVPLYNEDIQHIAVLYFSVTWIWRHTPLHFKMG